MRVKNCPTETVAGIALTSAVSTGWALTRQLMNMNAAKTNPRFTALFIRTPLKAWILPGPSGRRQISKPSSQFPSLFSLQTALNAREYFVCGFNGCLSIQHSAFIIQYSKNTEC
jgi:hypothetical protein